MRLTAYRLGADRWPMFSSSRRENPRSCIRSSPSGRSAPAMCQHGGGLRLVMAGVERGEEVEGRRDRQRRDVARLEGTIGEATRGGLRPVEGEHLLGEVVAGEPVKRLAGKVSAIRFSAWPQPQATSASSMPARSRSTSPGASGRIGSRRAASKTRAVASAVKRVERGVAAYGTPPLWQRQSTTWSCTSASRGIASGRTRRGCAAPGACQHLGVRRGQVRGRGRRIVLHQATSDHLLAARPPAVAHRPPHRTAPGRQ